MENTNCFAFNGETCNALDVMECPKNCAFYKTPLQNRKDKQNAQIHNVKLGLVDSKGIPVPFMCKDRYTMLKEQYEKEGRING